MDEIYSMMGPPPTPRPAARRYTRQNMPPTPLAVGGASSSSGAIAPAMGLDAHVVPKADYTQLDKDVLVSLLESKGATSAALKADIQNATRQRA
eukprot:5715759-Pyramimonas_sp.AAC.1